MTRRTLDQQRAAAVVRQVRVNHRRGLVPMPTGAGVAEEAAGGATLEQSQTTNSTQTHRSASNAFASPPNQRPGAGGAAAMDEHSPQRMQGSPMVTSSTRGRTPRSARSSSTRGR